MIRRRTGPLLVAALLATAGCAAAAPSRVGGTPAPLTLPASGPAGTSQPAAGQVATLTGFGVRIEVPVPAGWSRQDIAGRADYRDPTGQLLLRLQVSARTPGTLEDTAADLSRSTRTSLEQYRLIGITPVDGAALGPAVDWSFTFFRDGTVRQVIDRLAATGDAGVAVYFSAPRDRFGVQRPVWEHAVAGITVTRDSGN